MFQKIMKCLFPFQFPSPLRTLHTSPDIFSAVESSLSCANERIRRVLVATLVFAFLGVLMTNQDVSIHRVLLVISGTYRAQLSGELHALGDIVVRVLGRDQLGRRMTILYPVDHSGEH